MVGFVKGREGWGGVFGCKDFEILRWKEVWWVRGRVRGLV